MDAAKTLAALSALAYEHRLAAYRMPVERGADGLPAGVIAEQLGMPPSSLTFNLQHLLRAGLVTQRRMSRQLTYAADFAAMNDLVGYLTENWCGRGAAQVCAPLCSTDCIRHQEKQEISMKRPHVHVSVEAPDPAIKFYSTLFATEPSVLRTDYAKWMLEDPRVDFANSARGCEHAGVDHLGIQTDDETELGEEYDRLQAADGPVLQQDAVTCCYHQSEKAWITDPAGVQWEAFLTHGETTIYGDGGFRAAQAAACGGEAPAVKTTAYCCTPAPASACCTTAAE
jgi:DNA-binding transcriptional ArsR family regulator